VNNNKVSLVASEASCERSEPATPTLVATSSLRLLLALLAGSHARLHQGSLASQAHLPHSLRKLDCCDTARLGDADGIVVVGVAIGVEKLGDLGGLPAACFASDY